MLATMGLMLVPLLGAMAAARADSATGTWDVAAKFSITGGPGDGQSTNMKAVFELTQKGATLTGTFTPYAQDGVTAQPAMPLRNGHVKGTAVTFGVKQDEQTSLAFVLVLEGGHLRGSATPSKEVNGGGTLSIKIDATRRKM